MRDILEGNLVSREFAEAIPIEKELKHLGWVWLGNGREGVWPASERWTLILFSLARMSRQEDLTVTFNSDDCAAGEASAQISAVNPFFNGRRATPADVERLLPALYDFASRRFGRERFFEPRDVVQEALARVFATGLQDVKADCLGYLITAVSHAGYSMARARDRKKRGGRLEHLSIDATIGAHEPSARPVEGGLTDTQGMIEWLRGLSFSEFSERHQVCLRILIQFLPEMPNQEDVLDSITSAEFEMFLPLDGRVICPSRQSDWVGNAILKSLSGLRILLKRRQREKFV